MNWWGGGLIPIIIYAGFSNLLPPEEGFLLQENGSLLLQEDGFDIIITE